MGTPYHSMTNQNNTKRTGHIVPVLLLIMKKTYKSEQSYELTIVKLEVTKCDFKLGWCAKITLCIYRAGYIYACYCFKR